ncbi:hypothetical protein WICPIJ_005112 [Wickerhamomyces pijperi]|uniref:AP-2 complex subunit alpha n=1 Tax=Wickerhamomyces pijperi TaxID=599730 RepID=A0A9P8Q455_WICPI|nr:hypothetical protein WICPIJ_005112 [Wickerhamomyces pijperi]
MPAAPMKGLHQFISDLRGATTKEDQDRRIAHEIHNIQTQFNSNHAKSLTGYQRKKYIAKLIYIYINQSSNYSFEFNYINQILTLLSSSTYSEKSMGYLAISLLIDFSESSESKVPGSTGGDFSTLIVNSVKKDLNSHDVNDNLLALSCVATLGNQTFSDVLIEDVFQILRSPTSTPDLKKRSSLAFLKLLKASGVDILESHPQWIPRILTLLDDENQAVVLSVIPLVEFIAAEMGLVQAQTMIPILTNKLKFLIIEAHKVPQEYVFGGLSNPWLIIKICKLLELLLPDLSVIDQSSLRTLRECVARVIEISQNKFKDYSVKNAANAILFGVISLANNLDPSTEALISSFEAITGLLSSNDLNTRYLALNSLITLSCKIDSDKLQLVQERHLLQIIQIVKENHDISITRKSLDLIYIITNVKSCEFIISELFKVLKRSDHTLRAEIALKISHLSEKYATSATWYVTTMLELIDIAGPALSDVIWERVVQIVSNNESLQKITCVELVKYITKKNFQETMVKISAYLVGEFAPQIEDTVSLDSLFELFSQLYYYVGNLTRAMLLTTFLKLYKHSKFSKPLKSKIIKLLRLEINSPNSELQQRSYEYLTLISKSGTKEGEILFELVMDEMPVWEKETNPILLKLSKTNPRAKKELTKGNDNLVDQQQQAIKESQFIPTTSVSNSANSPPSSSNGELIKSMAQLNIQSTGRSSANGSAASNTTTSNTTTREVPLTPNWERGYHRLFEFNQGIFFENSLIKIILRTQKSSTKPELISLNFSLISKIEQKISSLIIGLSNYKTVQPPLLCDIAQIPETDIAGFGKSSFRIDVALRQIFEVSETPNLKIQFKSGTGGFNTVLLKLPIFMKSFIAGTELNFAMFLKRWKQIEETLNHTSHIALRSPAPVTFEYLARLNERLNCTIVPTNSEGFVFSAGILKTSQESFGVLLKWKVNAGADDVEVWIRATNVKVAEVTKLELEAFFKGMVRLGSE